MLDGFEQLSDQTHFKRLHQVAKLEEGKGQKQEPREEATVLQYWQEKTRSDQVTGGK